jgi:DegV family protein with EDD domain
MAVRIVTDSTCDLPNEVVARYGISVVPLYINVGDQGFLDGIDMKRDEFYTRLPTFSTHPTTAVPSPQKFHAVYQALADEGANGILSIHITAALSGTVDVARSAAQETTAVPVTVFDSQQLSLGTGFLVDTAAKMAAEGSSVTEITAALNDQIQRIHVFVALDTLEYLKRSGRMNKYMAGVATWLQIKPIMIMHKGKPSSERVRTRDRAMKRVVEMLAAVGTLERVAILHTHARPDRIAELCALAAGLLPQRDILTADINSVIGAHIGPDAVGFAVVAASRQ